MPVTAGQGPGTPHTHDHGDGPVHSHGHGQAGVIASREVTNRLKVVLAVTATFLVVEAVAGFVSGSLTLLADAGHMLTDVGALGLSLFTAWLGTRPADDSKTFGYRRWEILATLVNGTALILIAVGIVREAYERFYTPREINVPLFLGVAIAGLLVNLFSLSRLHGAHDHSLNVRGAYLHIMGDTLGSVGAIAAAVVIMLTGWRGADPLISVLMSVVILGGAWRLVRESVDVLLEAAPAHVSMPRVRDRILGVAGVAAIHDLHVWTVTSGMVSLSGHVVVPDATDHDRVLGDIRRVLSDLGIEHVTIQIEVEDLCEAPCDGEALMAARAVKVKAAK